MYNACASQTNTTELHVLLLQIGSTTQRRSLESEPQGCTLVKPEDQCKASSNPKPVCTPWVSIEYYCDADESFGSLIQRRTNFFKNYPNETLTGGYWFHLLEDKSAAAIFSTENGFPTPQIYACLEMPSSPEEVSFDEALLNRVSTLDAGFVIKATSLHSSQSVYVLPSGLNGIELISGLPMTLSDIRTELDKAGVAQVLIEEYIPGAGGNSLPTEYKFHMFPNPDGVGEPIVGGINVVYNRGARSGGGEECGCWAEVDTDWNRLDANGYVHFVSHYINYCTAAEK